MSALARGLLAFASPAGARGRLSVLVLHRVVVAPDTLFPEVMQADRFDELCGWLRQLFNVLPLDEAVRRLNAGTLPSRALAISFDDGYADNRLVALPILQRHGLPATIFVATGFLDGGLMWNDMVIEAMRASPRATLDISDCIAAIPRPLSLAGDGARRRAAESVIHQVKYLPGEDRLAVVRRIVARAQARLPERLMMTPGQVIEMHRAGMQIGAHTVTHPILARLGLDAARHEMAQSKAVLEDLIGEHVGLFAYPNGKPGEDYAALTVALARELGFDAAVTTAPGAAGSGSDPYQLPRFTPWDRTAMRFCMRMLRNFATRELALAA